MISSRRRHSKRRRNPSRRHKARSHSRSRSKRRRNPSRARRVRVKSYSRRRNPVRRRSSSRRRRNPSFGSALKAGFNKQFILNALLTSGGLILGTKTASFVAMIPGVDRLGRFAGLLNLVLGGVFAGLVKNPHAKSLFVGFAAGGAYNLVASNVSALGLSQISGDDLLGVEVGDEGSLVRLGVEVGDERPVVLMQGEGGGSWEGGSW
jgi:hypothetical protein